MSDNTTVQFLRLSEVLRLVPVSRAAWYAGVKDGDYPAQVKIGKRAVAWRRSDIEKLAAKLSGSWKGGEFRDAEENA